ncbi:secreted protein [Candidatus Magnetomorum sp. HK-1]|nr:secreted protein [Candidatus Magnetomorum sp. HK-1]
MTKSSIFVFCFVTLFLSFSAFAGEISGHISYRDGSNCSGCRVAASISWGGVTKAVYTDNKGNFTLRWSSDNSISELYVNGTTVRKNIRNGEYVTITVR